MTANAYQLSLVPIQVVNLIPKHDISADCQTYCEAIDGHQYAVKQVSDSPVFPYTPFDELFCYELARLSGIAVPQYSILKMPDQSLAFGSVWEGATIDDGFNTVYTDIKKGLDSYLPKQKFIERLSAIYAFDLFVHNEDRHSGNYLFRPSFDTHVMLAMDFSRSWTNLNCPIDRTSAVMNPTRLPMQYISPPHHINQNGNKSNTSLLAGFLWNIQQLGPICGGTFFKTLNLLLELTQMHINSILSKVPEEWCSSKRKDIIRNWWLSGEHINRINIIKGAYEHGTLV